MAKIRLAKEDEVLEESLYTTLIMEEMRLVFEFNDGFAQLNEAFRSGCCGIGGGGAGGSTRSRNFDGFQRRYNDFLNNKQLVEALRVSKKQFSLTSEQLIGCVGCKICVDRHYLKLPSVYEPSEFKPFRLDDDGSLVVAHDVAGDVHSLYSLLHTVSTRFKSVAAEATGQCRSKRNRRCPSHSLETLKSRFLGPKDWLEVWSALDEDCKQEVLIIDDDVLLSNLETYLKKHKFCGECKNKLLKAYELLIQGGDASAEKEYSPSMYEGFRCCPDENHIHVSAERRLLTRLFAAAESEMNGSRRERHAKTLPIAQEEILTCIGLYLYNRFQTLSQTLHMDTLSWKLLFYIGADCLRKNFYAYKSADIDTDIAQFCQCLETADLNRKQKKQQKRQRWKERKRSSKMQSQLICAEITIPNDDADDDDEEEEDAHSSDLSSVTGQETSTTPAVHCSSADDIYDPLDWMSLCDQLDSDVDEEEEEDEDDRLSNDDAKLDEDDASVNNVTDGCRSPSIPRRLHCCTIVAKSDQGYSSDSERNDQLKGKVHSSKFQTKTTRSSDSSSSVDDVSSSSCTSEDPKEIRCQYNVDSNDEDEETFPLDQPRSKKCSTEKPLTYRLTRGSSKERELNLGTVKNHYQTTSHRRSPTITACGDGGVPSSSSLLLWSRYRGDYRSPKSSVSLTDDQRRAIHASTTSGNVTEHNCRAGNGVNVSSQCTVESEGKISFNLKSVTETRTCLSPVDHLCIPQEVIDKCLANIDEIRERRTLLKNESKLQMDIMCLRRASRDRTSKQVRGLRRNHCDWTDEKSSGNPFDKFRYPSCCADQHAYSSSLKASPDVSDCSLSLPNCCSWANAFSPRSLPAANNTSPVEFHSCNGISSRGCVVSPVVDYQGSTTTGFGELSELPMDYSISQQLMNTRNDRRATSPMSSSLNSWASHMMMMNHSPQKIVTQASSSNLPMLMTMMTDSGQLEMINDEALSLRNNDYSPIPQELEAIEPVEYQCRPIAMSRSFPVQSVDFWASAYSWKRNGDGIQTPTYDSSLFELNDQSGQYATAAQQ